MRIAYSCFYLPAWVVPHTTPADTQRTTRTLHFLDGCPVLPFAHYPHATFAGITVATSFHRLLAYLLPLRYRTSRAGLPSQVARLR